MKAIIIYIIISTLISSGIIAQNRAENISLNETLSGNKIYEAKNSIVLQENFIYNASNGSEFLGQIVPDMILPDNTNKYRTASGGITTDPSLGYVVGAIPGSIAGSESGALTYTVPIEMPPGSRGIQPSLAVSYSSTSLKGIAGKGWSLSGISMISKVPRTEYYDGVNAAVGFEGTDVLAIDGVRIILKTNSTTEYQRVDGAIVKIEESTYGQNSPESYFTVTTKDARVLKYKPVYLNKEYQNNTILNAKVLGWALAELTNNHGDYIRYTYEYDSVSVGAEEYDYFSFRLKEINYGSSFAPHGNINVLYESLDAPIRGYYQSHHTGETKKVQKIQTYNAGRRLREYTFKYDGDILDAIGLEGFNGERFPDTKFSYHSEGSLTFDDWDVQYDDVNDQKYIPELLSDFIDFLEIASQTNNDITGNINCDIVEGRMVNAYTANFDDDSNLEKLIVWELFHYDDKKFGNDEHLENTYYFAIYDKIPTGGRDIIQRLAYDVLDDEEFSTFSISDINVNGIYEVSFSKKYIEPSSSEIRYGVYGKEYNQDKSNKISDDLLLVKFFVRNDVSNYYEATSSESSYKVLSGNFDDDTEIEYLLFDDASFVASSGLNTSSSGLNLDLTHKWKTVQLGNFNGNSKQDIILYDKCTGILNIYEFGSSSFVTIKRGTIEKISEVYFQDINNDGNSDVLSYCKTDEKWRCRYSNGVDFLLPEELSLPELNYKDYYEDEYTIEAVWKNKNKGYYTEQELDRLWSGFPEYRYSNRLVTNVKHRSIISPVRFNDYNKDSKLDISIVSSREWKPSGDVSLYWNHITYSFYDYVDNDFAKIDDYRVGVNANNYNNHRTYDVFYKYQDQWLAEAMNVYCPINEIAYSNDHANLKLSAVTILTGENSYGDNVYNIDYSRGSFITKSVKNYLHNPSFGSYGSSVVYNRNIEAGLISSIGYNNNNQTFSFTDALFKESQGFLGFKTVVNSNNATKKIKKYIFDSDMGALLPESLFVYDNNNTKALYSTTTYSYHTKVPLEIKFPKDGSFFYKKRINKTTEEDNLYGSKVETSITEYVDFTDNPQKTITKYYDNTQESSLLTKEVEYKYTNGGSWHKYLLEKVTTNIAKGSDIADTRTIDYVYNSSRDIQTKISDVGSRFQITKSYIYDTNNYLESVNTSAPNDNTTKAQLEELEYTFDYRYVNKKTTNGLSTSYQYDEDRGLLLRETPPNGICTNFFYDGFDRLLTTSVQGGAESSISKHWVSDDDIDGANRLPVFYIKEEQSGVAPLITYCDRYFRPIRTVTIAFDGSKIYQDKSYLGDKLYKETLPFTELSEYSTVEHSLYNYNEDFEQLSQVTMPDKSTKTMTSSPGERKIETTITQGGKMRTTSVTKDYLGQTILSTDFAGTSVNYKYDIIGRLKESYVNPNYVTTFEYDLVGNKTKINDPDAGEKIYDYNALGQLNYYYDEEHTLLNPNVSYEFDEHGRLEYEQGADAALLTYTYVESGAALGEVKTASVGGNTVSYSYDSKGRQSATIKTMSDGAEFTTGITYDNYNRIATQTYPSGFTTNYEYGSYGDLERIKANTDGEGLTTIYENMAFNKFGSVEAFHLDNGNYRFSINHDELGRETQKMGTDFYTYLTYNDAGHVSSREYRSYKEDYDYDEMDRLSDTRYYYRGDLNNSIYQSNYRYDKYGRFTYKTGLNDIKYEDTNRPNAISSIGNGIVKASQNVSSTYFNKTLSIGQGGAEYDYTYGPHKQRWKTVYKENSQVKRTKYYLGNYEKAEEENGDVVEYHYLSGDAGLFGVFVTTNNSFTPSSGKLGGLYYTACDHLGSPILVWEAESGDVIDTRRYAAWGMSEAYNPNNSSQSSWEIQPFADRGFTGHEHLPEVFGLIDMNGRMYDPEVGRFLSPDPYVQDPGNTQNYNRYAYCYNNPLAYTDPSGEFIFTAFLGPVGTIIDAACWGAVINGGINTISQGFSEESWNWGEFGKSLAIGAISGAASGGVGLLTEGLQVYGAIPGALIEGGTQGIAGGLAGGFGDVIMEGDWDAFGSGFAQGFTTGFIMGGISGGIEGYKNAQSVGANPWSGKLYQNKSTYSATLKINIPLQPDPEKHCYAYTNAYADAGHGNRPAAEFITAANGANGADAGQVFNKLDKSALNFSTSISKNQWDHVGIRLMNGGEILGTTSRNGVNHWVNVTRITTANKWKIVGGDWKRVLYSTSVWDPIKGHVTSGPTSFFSIISLY